MMNVRRIAICMNGNDITVLKNNADKVIKLLKRIGM